MIFIYCAKLVFQDVATGLFNALQSQYGNTIKVQMVSHVNTETDNDLYIMFGMNVFEGTMLPKHYIVYQFEQTGNTGVNVANNTEYNWFTPQYISILKGAKAIWDYSLVNIKNLKRIPELQKSEFKYVPVGYMPHLDLLSKATSKDIDVLFFGVMNDRRRHIHDKLVEAGLNVHFADYNLWGAQRTELVNRSKICLNLHYYTKPILETVRLSYLLSKRAFVISEKSMDSILDKSYSQNVVFADYDNIVSKCIEYLNNPNMLLDFTNNAYDTYKKSPYSDRIPMNYIMDMVKKINPSTVVTDVNATAENKNDINVNDTNPSGNGELDSTAQSIDQNYLYAEIEQMDDGSQLLKLPEVTSDDLPYVSLVTLTYNRSELFEVALRNYRLFKYPDHKLEWIILDDSNNKHYDKIDALVKNDPRIRHVKLATRKSISEKRNIAIGYASYDYIVFMDDDDYYLPESVLARVKLLLKYQDSGIKCVACTQIGIYNLMDNYSYLMDSKTPSEASMAFTRDFWQERPFPDEDVPQGEGIPFIMGRTNQIVLMPYMFNFVAVTHNKNVTGKLRTITIDPNEKYTNFFDLWDLNTQLFFIKTKRNILKINKK